MTRSKSAKRQLSTITTISSNEEKIINCEDACKLQENNTLLRNTQRKMIKEFIEILSKSSNEIKTCQTTYHKIFSKNNEKLTEYEKNLWEIFNTGVSSIDLYIKRNDNIVENLQSIQHSIPNETNDQSLRNKIQQLKLTSDQLSKEITDLEEQKEKLESKIQKQRTGAFFYTVKTKIFRTDPNKAKDDLKDVTKLIKNKNKSYTNAKATYYREAAGAIEQNTNNQLQLTVSMKQQFNDFVKAFSINSKQFNRALECCNPKKDLEDWKQNILCSITELESADDEEDQEEKINPHRKFVKSRSSKNEISDEETCQPLEPIKSRLSKNENTDEKINRDFKFRSTENENIGEQIYQSRSIEKQNSDNKTTTRQLSLPSSSVTNKNRHKKIKTSEQSPKFQSVDSDDNGDEN